MDRVETALLRFKEGFSCSQAILSTYGEEVGLARILGLKLAEGFGGGMGRMAETCGAVTGAFMREKPLRRFLPRSGQERRGDT